MMDASYPSGLHHYWKSSYLTNLSDEAIDTLVAHFLKPPSPQCHAIIEQLGGAVRRVAHDETAFYHRDMLHDLHPLLLFNREGDCLAAKLRSANVHSAEDRDRVLLPEVERQQKQGKDAGGAGRCRLRQTGAL
jgi:hypothetical protein